MSLDAAIDDVRSFVPTWEGEASAYLGEGGRAMLEDPGALPIVRRAAEHAAANERRIAELVHGLDRAVATLLDRTATPEPLRRAADGLLALEREADARSILGRDRLERRLAAGAGRVEAARMLYRADRTQLDGIVALLETLRDWRMRLDLAWCRLVNGTGRPSPAFDDADALLGWLKREAGA